jgi:N-acetylglucosamine-6-phosphate deacetylase
MFADPLL